MAQQQQPQGLHSLSTIIKRLEAVTSRLEDVAVSQQSLAPSASLRSPTATQHDSLAGIVAPGAAGAAVGAAAGAAAGGAAGGAPPPPPPPPPPAPEPEQQVQDTPATKAYADEIADGALGEFLAAAAKVGGPVEEHSQLVKPLVDAQLAFLRLASTHAKPPPAAFGSLLKPQADAIGAIMEAKDRLGRGKEGREWGAAFSTLAEGAPAWGWVQVEPAPAPYVGEMKNASQFWADRVIKQFKETNPDALAWARAFGGLIDALQRYVKQWHTTGVAWDPKGPPAPDSVPEGGARAAGGAPPPPPPPAPAAGGASGGAGGHAALLASLNKGGDITSGLRKVDASEQTHKNPSLRSTSAVPSTSPRSSSPTKRTAPPVKAKPAGFSRAPVSAKKPPRLELEGNKWVVEHQEDARDLLISNTQLSQTVHVYGCKNTVLRIEGKINAVSLVNCTRTSVLLDSVVSSASVTNCPGFELQITGSCPTVQVDTTDSGNVYLSKLCMDTVEIVTAKTSALNISIPEGEEGDFVERPVPEQMRTRVVGGKLVTEIVEHAG